MTLEEIKKIANLKSELKTLENERNKLFSEIQLKEINNIVAIYTKSLEENELYLKVSIVQQSSPITKHYQAFYKDTFVSDLVISYYPNSFAVDNWQFKNQNGELYIYVSHGFDSSTISLDELNLKIAKTETEELTDEIRRTQYIINAIKSGSLKFSYKTKDFLIYDWELFFKDTFK